MQGEIGFANGFWHYTVRLGPYDGVEEVLCVSGFLTEANARAALAAADLKIVQNHIWSNR